MLVLLADGTTSTVTITPSGNWSDPGSWGALVDKIGVGGFFAITGGLVCAFLVWQFGWAAFEALLGEKGWLSKGYNQWCEHLKTDETTTAKLADTLAAHLTSCSQIHAPGGCSNVIDVRKAIGHQLKGDHKMATKLCPEAAEDYADGLDALLDKDG